jgi:hypothetical protein
VGTRTAVTLGRLVVLLHGRDRRRAERMSEGLDRKRDDQQGEDRK